MSKSEQTSYKSLNGFLVIRSSEPVQLDNKIKTIFIDSITHELFEKPVYISKSQMVYEHNAISKWLLSSNVDPLTGLHISTGDVEIIPVLNFFLAMLCIEEKFDGKMHYHPPKGNIFDLMVLAKNFFHDNLLLKLFQTQNGNAISLDLADYGNVIEHNADNELLKIGIQLSPQFSSRVNEYNVLYSPLQLHQILLQCPFSLRYFDNKCQITQYGMFIHESIKINTNYSRGCTLSYEAMNKRIQNCGIFTISNIWDILFQCIDKSLRGMNQQFDIVNNFGKSDMIDYNKIAKQSTIDLSSIKLNTIGGTMQQCTNIFQNCQNIQVEYYMTTKSTSENVYQFYLKHIDKIDAQTKEILSKILDAYDISKCQTEFMKKREFFKFPSIYSQQLPLGPDFSFVELRNKKISNSFHKNVCFVGTVFTNVFFNNCIFCECSFIGANMENMHVLSCKFIRCSFYKTNKPTHNINCNFINDTPQ